MSKKLFLFVTAVCCCVMSSAETQIVSYLYPEYYTPNDAASGIKWWKTGEVEATVVTDAFDEVTWSAGWYVVTGADVTLFEGAVCSGDVHLILADGAKLTVMGRYDSGLEENGTPAICTSLSGKSFAIYGQDNQSGQLLASGTPHHAGINVTKNSYVIINGGVIDAEGLNGSAGIGSERSASGCNIIINGGTVTATAERDGAAIGAGEYAQGCNIIINGGTITARSTHSPADIFSGVGIGGGLDFNSNIIINDGTITAEGGATGTGISGSNIKVDSYLIVKADNNNPPTTVIANNGGNLASSLANKRYVKIKYDISDFSDTGLLDINTDANENVSKHLVNGHVIILRDGKAYDIIGHNLKK